MRHDIEVMVFTFCINLLSVLLTVVCKMKYTPTFEKIMSIITFIPLLKTMLPYTSIKKCNVKIVGASYVFLAKVMRWRLFVVRC